MTERFAKKEIEKYPFERIPLDRDIYIVDEKWLDKYEAMIIGFLEDRTPYEHIGFISYAAARSIGSDSLELSWYPNVFGRFHEVSVILPRDAFILCIGCATCDEKPRIFVKSKWLSQLHLRPYSAFALVDAIGVKAALSRGEMRGDKLVKLRDRIDEIAASTPHIAYIGFADSLLLKTNYSIGQHDSSVKYTYMPETIIQVIPHIALAFKDVLGMDVYATVTQGINEYEDDSLIHTAPTGNHISLNSLGLPFSQLLSIDGAARKAIKLKEHPPAQLYIDEQFYRSLRFRHSFDNQTLPKAAYRDPTSAVARSYVYTNFEVLIANLDPNPSEGLVGNKLEV